MFILTDNSYKILLVPLTVTGPDSMYKSYNFLHTYLLPTSEPVNLKPSYYNINQSNGLLLIRQLLL